MPTTRGRSFNALRASVPARPRAPGWVFTATALALAVLIAALALVSRQDAPPTIAEFAPQAVEQITQTAEDARASGGAGGDERPESQADSPGGAGGAESVVDVARVRSCVGDPPRQIEDPQSPPCVPYWSGDNGGATYKGVTRDEIRIAAPEYMGFAGQYSTRGLPILDLLASFFSTRFELYGRRLHVLDNNNGGCDAALEASKAARADEELKVFASLDGQCYGGYHYHEELARRQIPSVADENLWSDDRLRELRPFMWTYPMAPDQMFANIGEWTCRRLAGGRAVHAGGLEEGKPRAFGIVLQYQFHEQRLNAGRLERELASCGVTPKVKFVYAFRERDAQQAANVVLQMKNAGVTSVLCMCRYVGGLERLQGESTTQAWFPEWLVSTYGLSDVNFFMRAFAKPEHLDHTFGLTFQPKQVEPHDTPAVWALVEMDPAFRTPEDGLFLWDLTQEYRSLLLIASGIQLAGPHLTPQTFEQGLHRARFPNPAHRIMAGAAGFGAGGSGDYTMTDDGAEIWWSATEKGPYSDDAGAFCYVDAGVRHRKGAWPRGGDPFFRPDCDTGAA